MQYDIVIRNGRIIDTYAGCDNTYDVGIVGNRVVCKDKISEIGLQEIDATDCIVLPGLIDFHTHVFFGGTDIGISPDSAFLPLGVTTVVDAGSAGCSSYAAFSHSVIANSLVRIKSYLNVCSAGLATMRYHETLCPKYFDRSKIESILKKFEHEILGLKIRTSADLVGGEGLEPLSAALTMADNFQVPLVVHTTNPPVAAGQIAKLLRPNDVYAHVFHGTGYTIIENDSSVNADILSARERGVIFDAANGGNHWVFKVAKAALAAGFRPDIISTDITSKTLFKEPVFGLPYIMSKYINMGMNIKDVVAACTSVPAKLMGLAGSIGTLNDGAYADIAVFRLINHPTTFRDTHGETMIGESLLVPQLTICSGKLVYRRIDF